MPQSTCAQSIETLLERDLIGRVAIEDYLLLVGATQGVILQVEPAAQLLTVPIVSLDRPQIPKSSVPVDFPAAIQAVEQEVGRSLTSAQLVTLQELWQHLQGHTQLLVQIAAFSRENCFSLDQILFRIQQDDAVRSLTRLVLSPLPKAQRWIVALLTAMQGVGVRAEQIAAMIGPPNPKPSLKELLKRRLIEEVDDRYYLASELGDVLQEGFNAAPWMDRAIAHLTDWATTHLRSPQVLLQERQMLLFVLEWAVQYHHWQAVLPLGRAIESAFAVGARWQEWEQILHWSLQAAWASGDERAEAWALHQLGTLAFCQEKITFAYDTLSDALKLRLQVADEMGAQVTQHNIDQLKAAIVPPQVHRSQRLWIYVVLSAIALIAFVLLGTTIVGQINQQQRSPLEIQSR